MRIINLLLIIACTFFLVSCSSTSSDSTTTYTEAIISHWGYDFSEEIATENATFDGAVINWSPGEDNPTYASYDDYYWWRNSHLDTENSTNMTQDLGAVDIEDISSISESWEVTPNPLLVGHTYAAKCYDGYVLFEVLAIGTANITEATENDTWPVQVNYLFSETTSF
jgi:hypothetical protein